MHKTVHSLTMLLVLYHLLVGCCGHHAHADAPKPTLKASPHTACCGHGHSERNDGEEPASSEHPHESGCDGEICHFVVPQADGGSGLVNESVSANGFCWAAPAQDHYSAGPSANEPPLPAGIPSLRLHLVHQILLI